MDELCGHRRTEFRCRKPMGNKGVCDMIVNVREWVLDVDHGLKRFLVLILINILLLRSKRITLVLGLCDLYILNQLKRLIDQNTIFLHPKPKIILLGCRITSIPKLSL